MSTPKRNFAPSPFALLSLALPVSEQAIAVEFFSSTAKIRNDTLLTLELGLSSQVLLGGKIISRLHFDLCNIK